MVPEGRVVVGVDEVGRGCLAGPVVAAAVVLPTEIFPWFSEIRDSKKLTAKKRVYLANLITQHSLWAIREVSPLVIDEINILYASLRAMAEAVKQVYNKSPEFSKPGLVLVDGNTLIPGLNLPVEQEALIGGDDLHKSIGAASIIAKVYRDQYMTAIGEIYPEYGFARNKGYGSVEHREAIMVHGPCPIHRKTFSGVFEYVKS